MFRVESEAESSLKSTEGSTVCLARRGWAGTGSARVRRCAALMMPHQEALCERTLEQVVFQPFRRWLEDACVSHRQLRAGMGVVPFRRAFVTIQPRSNNHNQTNARAQPLHASGVYCC